MALMSDPERAFADAISRLAFANPFLPERIEAERAALGPEFVTTSRVWHAQVREDDSPNVEPLNAHAERLAETLADRLVKGRSASDAEAALYDELVLYVLYNRVFSALHAIARGEASATARVGVYARFATDLERYRTALRSVPSDETPEHVFALFFQVRRAFDFIFDAILGGSLPAARLRAAAWQSVFTDDMRAYRRGVWERMRDLTTLITGPSGSGKELVARAIGLSRYIPFDARRQAFAEDFRTGFHPLNLTALSTTLIESELFGHRKGSFTGAVEDRAGWLEACPRHGSVFLDEIAEVEPAVQAKLLRALEARTFIRVGETEPRRFEGKLIAATNRKLDAEIEAGRFRADLYYRLCGDVIETPSLEAQLRDSPEELGHLLRFLAERVAGARMAEALAEKAGRWIDANLGAGYRWPGNVRELEQCVRNIMVRSCYRPRDREGVDVGAQLASAMLGKSLTADELVRGYVTLVFAETGSYTETARRLGMDRRTVRAKVDETMLEQLRGDRP